MKLQYSPKSTNVIDLRHPVNRKTDKGRDVPKKQNMKKFAVPNYRSKTDKMSKGDKK
jgi:hypothetical protein